MYERLIENWLTNVHELGLQVPFCEMLHSRGHAILYISRHSRGEHGKDVVTRAPDGRLWTFQMKGGDVTFNQWRNELRGQVEDLVRLPVLLPGVSSEEPHTPVLVTNGEIRGDALDSIRQYAERWERDGHGALQAWQRHEMLAMFVEAHGSYLPKKLTDFRRFVELYIGKSEDRLPRQKFANFLETLVDAEFTGTRSTEIKRGIESMLLLGSYVLEQYERVGNHVAATEGWTIIGANILHVAEREDLSKNQYLPSLDLAWTGLQRCLAAFESEVLSREHLVVDDSYFMVEPHFHGPRISLVLGWLAGYALARFLRGEDVPTRRRILEVLKREVRMLRLCGEVDWPAWLAIALLLEKEVGSFESEGMMGLWARMITEANRGHDSKGIPNPYWAREKVIAWRAGELPKHEEEDFARHTYTLHSALDFLVRRLRRQMVSKLWPSASQLEFCDFIPDTGADWFRWRCKRGETRIESPCQPRSWSAWRGEVCGFSRSVVPLRMVRHPAWLLPIALTYPHRTTRQLSAFIDGTVTRRVQFT